MYVGRLSKSFTAIYFHQVILYNGSVSLRAMLIPNAYNNRLNRLTLMPNTDCLSRLTLIPHT
jgi:hypothetical protein